MKGHYRAILGMPQTRCKNTLKNVYIYFPFSSFSFSIKNRSRTNLYALVCVCVWAVDLFRFFVAFSIRAEWPARLGRLPAVHWLADPIGTHPGQSQTRCSTRVATATATTITAAIITCKNCTRSLRQLLLLLLLLQRLCLAIWKSEAP